MADKDKISALMDGELVDKALLQELAHNQDDQDTWHHYHLIGDVLRGEAPQQDWDIAGQVASALEHEPVHLPLSHGKQEHGEIAGMEAQPRPQEARRKLPGWLSQFGQVAVAACVSLMVIFGVQQYHGHGQTASEPTSQLPVLQTIPFAGSAEPVSLTRDSVKHALSEANRQEQQKRVHAMLRDYELQLRINSNAPE